VNIVSFPLPDAPTILALAALVASFMTGWAAIITAKSLKRDIKETKETTQESNQIIKTVEKSTNSAASASVAKIEGLEQKITMLLSALADSEKRAALLAQAASHSIAKGQPSSPPILEDK